MLLKFLIIIIYFSVFLFEKCFSHFGNTDTAKTFFSQFSAELAMAFNANVNWKGNNESSFLIAADMNYQYAVSQVRSKQFYNAACNLGFIFIIDSVWNKQNDNFQMQYIYKAGAKSISHSVTVVFNTHLLNSHSYTFNPVSQINTREITERAFTPSILELGCGTAYSFLDQSVVNLSLATARFRLLTANLSIAESTGIPIGESGSGIFYFDYGFSLQYYLVKKINHKTELKSDGKVFMKGVKRENYDGKLTGSVLFNLTGFLRIKAEIRLVYDPVMSLRMQYYNEVHLGFYYISGHH